MSPSDRRAALAAARLYLVSPARMRAGRLADLIPVLAEAGVDVVQLRDRTLPRPALAAEAAACAEAARARGVLFVVNDDPALARDAGADGVHVGGADLPVPEARRMLGPDLLIGRSTRGGASLVEATAAGADYAGVGPLWETPTKPGRPAIDPSVAAAALRDATMPTFAIGGLDERRAARAVALGARRVAVVRALVDAPDPAAAARRLRATVTGGGPRVLSVAGSDSGGGAGLQADVKAIVRAGGFPMCAVTALTAQTTTGVRAIALTEAGMVAEQIVCVAEDIGCDAVKTGMLGRPELVEVVAGALATAPLDDAPVVVDTVLRAESGAPLMAAGGEEAYRRHLLPLARVITPNLFEAQALAGDASDDAARLAQLLRDRHGCAVIVTGGHGPRGTDVLCDGDGVVEVPGVRLPRDTTHGAGCTHSATLATLLAAGLGLREAAEGAKRAATAAVAGGRPYGAGAGPVDVTRGGAPPW